MCSAARTRRPIRCDEDGKAKRPVRGSETATEEIFRIPCMAMSGQEPLQPGFTLPGVVCGRVACLVAKRIKNVGAVFLPDLILAPAFALLFEVDVSSKKV